MGRARLFLLDNHDSFTFNLAQGFRSLEAEVVVRRDDAALREALAIFAPTHLVLSPGPQRPVDHPCNRDLLASYAGRLPILGVCLGHQAINEWCGGTLACDPVPMHGKTSTIVHDGDELFAGVPSPCEVARYHSLRIERLGDGLRATAWTEERHIIMAIRHQTLPLYGVQFHPESFLTPDGMRLLENFLYLSS